MYSNKQIENMTAEQFNSGDLVMIELIEWNNSDKSKKPISIISNIVVTVKIDKRGKRFIEYGNHGKSLLKNFKKNNEVKGSFGMIMWKSSWLNVGYKVLGGLDFIREKKLESLLS